MEEIKDKLKALKAKLEVIVEKLEPEKKRQEIRKLEAESMKPGFWDDTAGARVKMQRLAELQDEVQAAERLKQQADDLMAMTAEEELRAELDQEVATVEKQVDKLELQLFLGGKYDGSEAIFSIHAGQGGTEAMDWTVMLKLM